MVNRSYITLFHIKYEINGLVHSIEWVSYNPSSKLNCWHWHRPQKLCRHDKTKSLVVIRGYPSKIWHKMKYRELSNCFVVAERKVLKWTRIFNLSLLWPILVHKTFTPGTSLCNEKLLFHVRSYCLTLADPTYLYQHRNKLFWSIICTHNQF